MNRLNAGVAFILLLTWVSAGEVFAQGSGTQFKSNADDLAKLGGVVEEFRQDILRKDGNALTKLVLNPDVFFHQVLTQEVIDTLRRKYAKFDGMGPNQLAGFVNLLATSKDKLEEPFRNIEIRQDGDLGLVTLNYDFVINDKVSNSGIEVWQLFKVDGQWKIVSVVWTSYDA